MSVRDRMRHSLVGALAAASGAAGLLALAGGAAPWAAISAAAAAGAGVFWLGRRLIAVARHAEEEGERLRRNLRGASTPLHAKITEGIDDPLLLLDSSKRVLDANGAARTLFGERIVGRDAALHLRHPDILEHIAKVVAGAPVCRFEIKLSTPVERHYAVVISRVGNQEKAPLREREDEPAFHIVVFLHDITQMKLTERMRADFVANASHELRTPLSSLIGFLETLRGPAKSDPEAMDRFLAIMNEEAQRMVRLIDDLLSLSRIELDKHLQPRTPADIGGILDGAAKSLEPAAKARGMTIALSVPPGLPKVRGAPDQIFQMVQNLLSNSLKYADPETTISLTAEAQVRVPGSGRPGVSIRVADRGPGIAPEHLPRLTERFYRVDAARSRKMGGTGLGLAIVKHIVNRHRGHLDIESTPGEGTTVTVTLPIYEEDPAQAAHAAQ